MFSGDRKEGQHSIDLRWLRRLPGGKKLQQALAGGDFSSIDLAIRRTFFELFASISFLFLMLEATLFFYDGRSALGWMLVGYAGITATAVAILLKINAVRWFGRLSVLAAYTLFASGFVGVLLYGDSHYFVWAVMFIPIAFYFEGIRGGLLWLLVFGATILLFYNLYLNYGGQPFANSAIRETIISFSAITVFFAVFERIRSVYEAKVILLNFELESLAATDKLTGVPNRRKLEEDLVLRVRDAKRNRAPLSLILFDIDHFKVINDTHGHDIGDVVLQTICNVVKEGLRGNDSFGRWGGEEFLAILPQTQAAGAVELAEHIRQIIAVLPIEREIRVTASFGVAEYDLDESLEALLKRVDLALYAAKNAGRNNVKSAQVTFQ